MPWRLDTGIGQLMADVSGRWVSDETFNRPHQFSLPEGVNTPVHVRMSSTPDPIPQLTELVNGSVFVGETARDLLSEFQAEGLQFSEASVTMPSGRLYSKPVFLLTFGAGIWVEDGIIIEQSDVCLSHITHVQAPDGRRFPLPPRLEITRHPPRLMWDPSAVGNRHVWADTRLKRVMVVSDQLYQALKSEGLTGFQAQECRFVVKH